MELLVVASASPLVIAGGAVLLVLMLICLCLPLIGPVLGLVNFVSLISGFTDLSAFSEPVQFLVIGLCAVAWMIGFAVTASADSGNVIR